MGINLHKLGENVMFQRLGVPSREPCDAFYLALLCLLNVMVITIGGHIFQLIVVKVSNSGLHISQVQGQILCHELF